MFKENFLIVKRYYKLIEKDKNMLIPFYICVCFSQIIDLIIPIAISSIINFISKGLYIYSIIAVIVLLLLYFLDVIFSYFDCKIYSNFMKQNYITLHKKIVNEVYQFDEEYQQKISKGKIINSINMDLINISEMADYINKAIIHILKLIALFICFIYQKLELAILILVLNIIYIKLSYYLNQRSAHYFVMQRKSSDKLIGLLNQVLNGLKDIKTLNISTPINKKFHLIQKKWQQSYILKRKYIIIQKTILKYIVYGGKVVLYLVSILLISKGYLELGTIILLISYYDKFFSSSIEVMESEAKIKEENVSMERIYEILEYNKIKEIEKGEINKKESNLIENIIFDKVTFSYNTQITLRNLSFEAEPNKLTVIVGKAGSGKTTIFNLILNLYHHQKGNIIIGGNSINKDNDYLKYISILNQNTFLFNLSIKENLSFVEKDEKKQIEICKKVGIHDFIMSLPKGYNEVLKEDATNLSGGQKRLLSLARTLLDDKKILLLDEITSSLDPTTTDNIIELLSKLKKNYIIIAITHKKELMKKADKIIVLNRGRKVGEGTHSELMKTNRHYQKLQNKKFLS